MRENRENRVRVGGLDSHPPRQTYSLNREKKRKEREKKVG